ncbi:MAG: hypothetical protein JWR80_9510 [Bradyrhizobium sp.]|nr:hypothetical protein [Bradyrhizobium sp.]
MSLLRKVACFFGTHSGAREALGSTMGRTGPRHLYQCKECGRYFSEPW